MLDSDREKIERNAKALTNLGEEEKVKGFLYALLLGNCICYRYPDSSNPGIRYDHEIIEFLKPIKHLHPYIVVSRKRKASADKPDSKPDFTILMIEPVIESDATPKLDDLQQTILFNQPGWSDFYVSSHEVARIISHFDGTKLVKRVVSPIKRNSKKRRETSIYRLG